MGRPRKMPAQKPGMSEQSVSTPGNFLQAVHSRWGFDRFDYDLAAEIENAKAEHFFQKEQDALAFDWTQIDGNLWLNPEFGDIDTWAKKCALSAPYIEGQISRRRIFFLTPASVGANWFAEWVWGRARVIALNGRLTFDGHDQAYPKDCCLSVFGERPGFEVWKWPGGAKSSVFTAVSGDETGPAIASGAAPNAVFATTPARGPDEAGPARACKGPGGNHRFDTVPDAEGKRHCSDCDRLVSLPQPMRLTPGEADGRVSTADRKGFLIRAHQEKLLSFEELSGDIDDAWITLQYRAPPGWFTSQPTEPPEPEGAIGMLHAALTTRGVLAKLPEIAAWSTFQRDVARLWVEQGGEKPPFFPSACAACDRGDAPDSHTHTGEGTQCRPVKKKKPAAQTAPEPAPSPPLPPEAGHAGSGVVSAAERTVPLFEF
jgi:phage N-6-adenine-methyltransferase